MLRAAPRGCSASNDMCAPRMGWAAAKVLVGALPQCHLSAQTGRHWAGGQRAGAGTQLCHCCSGAGFFATRVSYTLSFSHTAGCPFVPCRSPAAHLGEEMPSSAWVSPEQWGLEWLGLQSLLASEPLQWKFISTQAGNVPLAHHRAYLLLLALPVLLTALFLCGVSWWGKWHASSPASVCRVDALQTSIRWACSSVLARCQSGTQGCCPEGVIYIRMA